MNTPKISIIVPVYKVEKYLRRCLDSIVAQTFTDWECILIDDGSPDNDIVNEPLIKKFYKVFNPKKLYNFAKNRINRKKLEIEKKNNDRQFELFRQKYIAQSPVIYTSLKELQDNPPIADAYIVGSDQVWNFYHDFSHRKNLVHAYFLDYGSEKIKRMAFAASWGRTEITDEEISEIKPLLKHFNYISVREESYVGDVDEKMLNGVAIQLYY